MATFRNYTPIAGSSGPSGNVQPALSGNYDYLNGDNVLQNAGNITGLNPYLYQPTNTQSGQVAFDNQNTANFGNLGINNVDTAGVSQVQNQANQRNFSFTPEQNPNIALAEGQLQGAITGQDAASRALEARQSEQQSAREAAQRGLQEQQFAQAGTTDAQQNVLRQQQDRAFAGERQENLATLGQQTLARADSATQQLANLGMQQQQFNQQAQQLEDARGRWESEFGLQAEMSKQDIEKWAAQFNMSVEQAKDMQDQWKSNLITQQTGMQMSADQFYDSLNLDRDRMKIANEQWKSEFGLQKIMSEADLEQWAAEYGLTVEQAKQMEQQWNAEFQLQQDKFDESLSQWNKAFGFEREQFQQQIVQQAIDNKMSRDQLKEAIRSNKAGESLSETQINAQVDQIENAINKSKYDAALLATDFTNQEEVAALGDSYRNWSGTDEIPSYSQLVNESWDLKESKAGEDMMAYITNMGYQANDVSFQDAWNRDSALRDKLTTMIKAQLGSDATIGRNTVMSMGSKIYNQMIKSPTQLDREQARSDYQSTDMYQSALSSGDTAKIEELDQLFTDLDFLSQTGGLKAITLPDGTMAVADAGGEIVSSSGDYADIGKLDSGSRYVTDQDGISHVSVDGNDIQIRRDTTGDGYRKRIQTGRSAYSWVPVNEEADASLYAAAEEIYGGTSAEDADSAKAAILSSGGWTIDAENSKELTNGPIKYNPYSNTIQWKQYGTGEYITVKEGEEFNSWGEGRDNVRAVVTIGTNGVPVVKNTGDETVKLF
jgi:hypothetical protein